MEFTLKIKLGNDAMQTGDDLADALSSLADYFAGSTGQFDPPESYPVKDRNGNTVGRWEVSE